MESVVRISKEECIPTWEISPWVQRLARVPIIGHLTCIKVYQSLVDKIIKSEGLEDNSEVNKELNRVTNHYHIVVEKDLNRNTIIFLVSGIPIICKILTSDQYSKS